MWRDWHPVHNYHYIRIGGIHPQLSSAQALVSGQDSSGSGTLGQAASYTQQVFTTFQFVNSQQFSSKGVKAVQLSENHLALPVCALEIRITALDCHFAQIWQAAQNTQKVSKSQIHKSNLSSSLEHKIQIKACYKEHSISRVQIHQVHRNFRRSTVLLYKEEHLLYNWPMSLCGMANRSATFSCFQ